MSRTAITTQQAPAAIGTYSQAVRMGNLVFLSGQIGLDPETMTLVSGTEKQIHQVLDNLTAVANAAGFGLSQAGKITVYLTDLNDFALVNDIMATYLAEPYPARAVVGVAALPKGASVEMDAWFAVENGVAGGADEEYTY